jgi:fatty acid desaturase
LSLTPSAPEAPSDLDALDLTGFARELRALEAEAVASLGPEDLAHMRKLERWGAWCTAAGYATAWTVPNPLSMVLLSTGSMSRWAVVAHHVMHKGMDRVPGTPERLTSRGFTRGRRRLWDWFDWFVPEAWHHEHNVLHHGYTNEVTDPDLVELNVESIRDASLPRALKLLTVAAYACTWKLTYYAPSTMQILQRKNRRRASRKGTLLDDARGPERYAAAFDPRTEGGRETWWRSILPYGLGRFVVIPALFAPLGPLAVASVWLNSLGAELVTNLHTFAIVAPNHAGADLQRFTSRPRDRGEWFVRQVLGSVNFTTGRGDLSDFLHGFLNYQIEHHLFPDLPPLQYQRLQPKVRALCEKYGVPYRQEPVVTRLNKLVAIAIGDASMQQRGTAAEVPGRAEGQPFSTG